MMLRKLLKHRGFGINLLAGFSFILLAVYGWGLGWEEVGSYLLIILIFLVGLIGLAALLGWLLRKAMSRGENRYPVPPKGSIENETQVKAENPDDVKRD